MNPSARVTGFCEQEAPHGAIGHRQATVVEGTYPELREPVVTALRGVHDPEIPINIYDLGLIYRIDLDESGDVVIDMTLTAPSCPVAGMMPLMVKNAVGQVDGVGLIQVNMVWEPPWSPDHLSEEARLELGLI